MIAKMIMMMMMMKMDTVFCVISAPGAFEIRIKKVPLFIAILH